MIQTVFEFTLPKGFIDDNGDLHRRGLMRLATARDEIAPLNDARVRANEAYLALTLISQVIIRLGPYEHITANMLDNFFAIDVMYLQQFYTVINGLDQLHVMQVSCPNCGYNHEVDIPLPGE